MPWRKRKKKELEPEDEGEKADAADVSALYRPQEETQDSPEERHRWILGLPRTSFDVPGKTRTAWRRGPDGRLYPYPIADVPDLPRGRLHSAIHGRCRRPRGLSEPHQTRPQG